MRLIDADPLERMGYVLTRTYQQDANTMVYETKKLSDVSSVQPKTGEWIIKDNPETGWYRITCSECGEDVTSTAPCIGFYPNAKVTWDYCPNCGADMRGDEE